MRNLILSAVGGLLVFATHSVAPFLSPETVDIYSVRAHGRPGFAAVFSPWAWWSLTKQRIPSNLPLADGAEREVRMAINRGVVSTSQDCPDRWLITDIRASEDGYVAITGYCTSDSDSELESD
jgi:hypothetical protein